MLGKEVTVMRRKLLESATEIGGWWRKEVSGEWLMEVVHGGDP